MARWQGWQQVPGGGRTFDAPAATGAADVFVRGTDNRIFHNHLFSGTNWSGWNPVQGMTTRSAPATTIHNGILHVFVRGEDDLIYFNRTNGQWEGWQPVPGGERTQDALGVAPGVLVARRADGAIRYNTFDGPNFWGGWRDVPGGGVTTSAPAITDFIPGFFLFVRGTDNGIHYKRLGADRQSWDGWQRIPDGLTPSTPAVARGLLLVRGTDNGIHQNGFRGG